MGLLRGDGVLHNTGLEMQADAGFAAAPDFSMPASGDGPVLGFDWFWRKRRAAEKKAKEKKARKSARHAKFQTELTDAQSTVREVLGVEDAAGVKDIANIENDDAFSDASMAEDSVVSAVETVHSMEGHRKIDKTLKKGKITPYQAFIRHRLYDHSHAISQNARALHRYGDNPQRARRDFDKIKACAKDIHDHAVNMRIEWEKAKHEFKSPAIGGPGGENGAQTAKNEELVARQTEFAQNALKDVFGRLINDVPELVPQFPAEYLSFMGNAIARVEAVKAERDDAIGRAMSARHDVSEDSKEKPVVPTTDEGFESAGAAFFDLRAQTDAEADALVDAADGYLFKDKDADGTIHLKATVPEFGTSSANTKAGGRKFEFRRNMNRFTRMVAKAVVTEDGSLQADAEGFYQAFGDVHYAATELVSRELSSREEGAADISFFESKLGNYFTEDLYSGEKREDAIASLLLFLKSSAVGGEAKDTISRFIANIRALEQTPQASRIESIGKELQESRITKEEHDRRIESVNTAYTNMDTAKTEMARARKQGLDDKDIYLINACSANAAMGQAAHGDAGVHIVRYATADSVEPNLSAYRNRLKSLCNAARDEVSRNRQPGPARLPGRDADLPTDGEIDGYTPTQMFTAINSILNLIKYDYHEAAVAHSSGHGMITTEAFAAETGEYMVSPFTKSKKAVGLYRPNSGGDSSFQNYYNNDDPLPADLERLKLIHALEAIKAEAITLQRGMDG
jgi:hypothetical protein